MNTPELKMQLPFEGFYNTHWEDAIDSQLWCDAEYLVETDERFKDMIVEDVQDTLQDLVNWKDTFTTIAKAYARNYGDGLQRALGLSDADFGWQFESLERPRNYNFETDRVCVLVSENVVHLLFEQTDKDILRKVVYETFKDRSGFTPFYSKDAEVWLETPVEDWDHNKLGTLLYAWLETPCDRKHWVHDWYVYEVISEAVAVNADSAYEALVALAA